MAVIEDGHTDGRELVMLEPVDRHDPRVPYVIVWPLAVDDGSAWAETPMPCPSLVSILRPECGLCEPGCVHERAATALSAMRDDSDPSAHLARTAVGLIASTRRMRRAFAFGNVIEVDTPGKAALARVEIALDGDRTAVLVPGDGGNGPLGPYDDRVRVFWTGNCRLCERKFCPGSGIAGMSSDRRHLFPDLGVGTTISYTVPGAVRYGISDLRPIDIELRLLPEGTAFDAAIRVGGDRWFKLLRAEPLPERCSCGDGCPHAALRALAA